MEEVEVMVVSLYPMMEIIHEKMEVGKFPSFLIFPKNKINFSNFFIL